MKLLRIILFLWLDAHYPDHWIGRRVSIEWLAFLDFNHPVLSLETLLDIQT
ncbi:hypothetical protein J6590_038229 [Homalodisca vitripennis]|nr:hypothetical protein J6590_038229 [Homalodisca vitripennis]